MVMRTRDTLQLRMSEALLMCSPSHCKTGLAHCQQQQHSSNSSNNEARTELRHKPLKKKGLSKFYASKSQSFSSLELALTTQFGESALGLAKRPSSYDLMHAAMCGTLPHQASTGNSSDVLYDGDVCAYLRHASIDEASGPLRHSFTGTSAPMPVVTGLQHVRCSALSSTCPAMDTHLADSLVGWMHQSMVGELCAALRSSSLDPSTMSTSMPGSSSGSIGGSGKLHPSSPQPHRHHQVHHHQGRSHSPRQQRAVPYEYGSPHCVLTVGDSQGC